MRQYHFTTVCCNHTEKKELASHASGAVVGKRLSCWQVQRALRPNMTLQSDEQCSSAGLAALMQVTRQRLEPRAFQEHRAAAEQKKNGRCNLHMRLLDAENNMINCENLHDCLYVFDRWRKYWPNQRFPEINVQHLFTNVKQVHIERFRSCSTSSGLYRRRGCHD